MNAHPPQPTEHRRNGSRGFGLGLQVAHSAPALAAATALIGAVALLASNDSVLDSTLARSAILCAMIIVLLSAFIAGWLARPNASLAAGAARGSQTIAVWVQDWTEVRTLIDRLGSQSDADLEVMLRGDPLLVGRAWSLVRTLDRNRAAALIEASAAVTAGQISWLGGPALERETATSAMVAFGAGRTSFEADVSAGASRSAPGGALLLADFLRRGAVFETIVSMVDLTAHERRSEDTARLRRRLQSTMREAAVQLVSRLLLFELQQSGGGRTAPASEGQICRHSETSATALLKSSAEQTADQALALDIRRMLARMASHAEPLELRRLLLDAVETMRPELEESGVAAIVLAEPGLPTVTGDRFELLAASIAILENAIEAIGTTDPLERIITISAASAGGELRITFMDTGGGVAATDRPSLLAPFHTTKPRKQGLGLAMCRDVVEAIGGEIEIPDRAQSRGFELIMRLPADG